MSGKDKYPVKPTPEQIQEWKDIHGTVYKIDVEDKVCYLKPPDRKTLEYAQIANKNGGGMKFNEALLNNCWLGGDPEIKTDDAYFLGVGGVLAEIIDIKEAKLEKI